jgi:hypothetical protein
LIAPIIIRAQSLTVDGAWFSGQPFGGAAVLAASLSDQLACEMSGIGLLPWVDRVVGCGRIRHHRGANPARQEARMSSIQVLDEFSLIGWTAIGAALAVLWLLLVLLPFAVFGTKRRIDRLSDQLEAIHAELRRLNERGLPYAPLRATPAEEEEAGRTRIDLRIDEGDRLV